MDDLQREIELKEAYARLKKLVDTTEQIPWTIHKELEQLSKKGDSIEVSLGQITLLLIALLAFLVLAHFHWI